MENHLCSFRKKIPADQVTALWRRKRYSPWLTFQRHHVFSSFSHCHLARMETCVIHVRIWLHLASDTAFWHFEGHPRLLTLDDLILNYSIELAGFFEVVKRIRGSLFYIGHVHSAHWPCFAPIRTTDPVYIRRNSRWSWHWCLPWWYVLQIFHPDVATARYFF